MIDQSKATTVGFIGLGHMGKPMAINLAKAGFLVRGFDIVESALTEAARHGVESCSTAAEAAGGADVVITMLPSGRHVLEAYQGEEGLLANVATGALLVDCSTIDIASARRFHEIAGEIGLRSVDAPVSGGVMGAEAATLTFMVGGSGEAFQRVEPILDAMGRAVIHCGQPGAGQAAKLCNNMILGISMIGISEAFVLGESLGLSNAALFDVASQSSGQCWALTTNCPVPGPVPTSPANNDYEPGFAAALMLKDLTLAQEAAQAEGTTTTLGKAAYDLYARYVEAGEGGTDFSGIVRWIRDSDTQ